MSTDSTETPDNPPPLPHAPATPLRKKRKLITRRGFLKTFAGTLATGAGVYAYGATIAVHNLVVEQVTVQIPDLAARWHNRRIVHLSDLHVGRTSLKHVENAFRLALEQNPEFVVITGDFVDSTLIELEPFCKMLAPMAKQVQMLGCTGNHDFSKQFRDAGFADTVSQALTAAGVRMLRNDFFQPLAASGGAGVGDLCFVGVEDLWSRRLDPHTLSRVPPNSSVILLCHNPDSYEMLEIHRWHLMLSGHTHGGQVCVPFWGPILLPVEHRERAAGLFHLDKSLPHRALYVSRGVGHLLKVRLFCPPEVTCITLRNPEMA